MTTFLDFFLLLLLVVFLTFCPFYCVGRELSYLFCILREDLILSASYPFFDSNVQSQHKPLFGHLQLFNNDVISILAG